MSTSAQRSVPTDRYLIRGDVRLRFRDEGHGLPVVLVHGWALTLEMWQPQVEALSERFRILRMDRRGFGESTGPPDLDADARDLVALLDELGISRVALLGMSQGARTALTFAAIAGERIGCLVLDGAPADERLGLPVPADNLPLAHYRQVLEDKGIEAVRSELASLPFLRLQTGNAQAHRLVQAILQRYSGADLRLPVLTGGATTPVTLQHLKMPLLVLTGEFDSPQRRRAADALCEALPHAQRATVPRAGHLANLDNPESYNTILARFLERHAPTSDRA